MLVEPVGGIALEATARFESARNSSSHAPPIAPATRCDSTSTPTKHDDYLMSFALAEYVAGLDGGPCAARGRLTDGATDGVSGDRG